MQNWKSSLRQALLAPLASANLFVVTPMSDTHLPQRLGVVGSYNGSSAVAVAPKCAVTAGHTGDAAWYTPVHEVVFDSMNRTQTRRIPHPTWNDATGAGVDLAIIKFEPAVARWALVGHSVAVNDEVLLGGFGQTSTVANGSVYGGPRAERWGTNKVMSASTGYIYTRYDGQTVSDGAANPSTTPYESYAMMNDSGGGLFKLGDNATLLLQGILYGGGFTSSAVNVVPHRLWILENCYLRADWNKDGRLSPQDIYDFLEAYYSQTGDFNRDTRVTVQDIFDFLQEYAANSTPETSMALMGDVQGATQLYMERQAEQAELTPSSVIADRIVADTAKTEQINEVARAVAIGLLTKTQPVTVSAKGGKKSGDASLR